MITVAVDVMGGDHAPFAPVSAIQQAAAEFSDTTFVMVGDEEKIREVVKGALAENIVIRHAPGIITGEDEPVRAVRRKQDSSLVVAATMVNQGQADMMLSAGNTGAIVAAGLLVIGRMSGVERPALAPILPTFTGQGVLLLDVGATMDASAQNLLEFARMGSAYSQFVLEVQHPRVGLLNVGTEDSKGNAITKQTFPLLKNSGLHFVGNVEARDMLNGSCDVVVCDGFVGNVVLKLAEGFGMGILSGLKSVFLSSFKTKLAASILKPSLKSFFGRMDYSEFGGAPFLGVSGGCYKAHGSSNARAWFIALSQARKFVKNDLIQQMQKVMGQSTEEEMN